ncbi:hypothetical protein OPQ81_008467 [Rhizoctonia solani]|nr:hypothetical protein OPQ81_008467 [Rhizoctonia solani]
MAQDGATTQATRSWKKIWDSHIARRIDSDHRIPRPPALKLHPIFNVERMPRERSSRLVQLITGHGACDRLLSQARGQKAHPPAEGHIRVHRQNRDWEGVEDRWQPL